MGKEEIRIAIVGVGNCASSLVQGLTYYMNKKDDEQVPGIMHVKLGDYNIWDIEIVAAFDVITTKVGKDLSEAIYAYPNNTYRFAEVPYLDVKVQRGMTRDGLGRYVLEKVQESEEVEDDFVQTLKDRKVDIVVSYLPVGSEKATQYYVEGALEAGCGFINCIPVFIASKEKWRRRFEEANLPIIGDDIKSQVGATIVHRLLTKLFVDRGVKIEHTYQLNFGGNMDFMNMLERGRLESKKISKTNSVKSQLPYEIGDDNIHVGPSDYVPWLEDRKFAHIRVEGRTFGDVPLSVDLKLEVWDSPNSAGVVIDAIRCAKIAMDRKIGGALLAPSAYFMKSPPDQFSDEIAKNMLDNFIMGFKEGKK